MQLWNNGAITQETLLGALKKGEILPDVDVEEEVELTGQEKLDNIVMQQAPAAAAVTNESEEGTAIDDDVREGLAERMRGFTANRDQQESDED